MTVSTRHNKRNYVGNGVLVEFAYDFPVLDANHLFVLINDVQQTIGYTVAGIGSPTGGTVTFTVAPESEAIVTLLRFVPETQLIDYQPYDPFPAEVNEQGLDLLTMIAQQLQEQQDRTLVYPPSDDGSTATQFPAWEPGKHIAWDTAQRILVNADPGELGGAPSTTAFLMGAMIDGATGNTIKGGTGLSSAKLGTGNYQITFDTAFSDAGYVLVPQIVGSDGYGFVSISNYTSTGFEVKTRDAASPTTLVDLSFAFILTYEQLKYGTLTVLNPSWESGDLTNWNVFFGNPAVVSSIDGVNPQHGSYFLSADPGDVTYALQSDLIDLVAAGLDPGIIDSGLAMVNMQWWQRALAAGNDTGRGDFYFYGAGGIGDYISNVQAPMISPTSWTQRTLESVVPVGTRFVGLRFHSESQQGGRPSAYHDNVSAGYSYR